MILNKQHVLNVSMFISDSHIDDLRVMME